MVTVKNTLFFLLSFALVLLGLDLFLRVSYIENTSPTDFTQTYGRCRVKDRTFVYFNEGFGIGRFNAGRYLGPYYPENKPEGVFRIAVLGDSYVEGFQVFERDHFLKIAETKLNKELSVPVQVLNFGRSGFDFGDMYAYYERMVKAYQCDVILFFLSSNDLHIKQTDSLIPKVVIDDKKQLQVTNKLMPEEYLKQYFLQRPMAQNSIIFNMMNKSRKLFSAGEWKPKLFDKFHSLLCFIGKANAQDLKKHQATVSSLNFVLLDKLKNEASKIILVNREKSILTDEFVQAIPPPIKLVNLSEKSKIYSQSTNPHYWWITKKRGHWNIAAHEVVGEFLSSVILETYGLFTKPNTQHPTSILKNSHEKKHSRYRHKAG